MTETETYSCFLRCCSTSWGDAPDWPGTPGTPPCNWDMRCARHCASSGSSAMVFSFVAGPASVDRVEVDGLGLRLGGLKGEGERESSLVSLIPMFGTRVVRKLAVFGMGA